MDFFRRSLTLLQPSARRKFVLFLVGSVLVSVLEMCGVALVLPLVRLLADPESIRTDSLVRSLSHLLHTTSASQLTLYLSALVFTAFVVKGVLSIWFVYANFGFLLGQEALTAVDLLHGYMHAPYTFHLRRNSSELLQRIEGSLSIVYTQVIASFLTLGTEAFVLVGVGAVLIAFEPLSAVFGGLYFGSVALLYHRIAGRRAVNDGHVVQRGNDRAFAAITNSLGGVKELTVRGRRDHFVDELYVTKQKILRGRQFLALLGQLPRYFLETALIVGIGLLSLVLFHVRTQADALAALGLFAAAGFRLLPSLNRLLVALSTIRGGTAPLDALIEDRRQLTELGGGDDVGGAATVRLDHELRFDDLSYRYPGSQLDVLQRISFAIGRGEAVGLVGPSGAGKSTIVDLVLGLLQPTSGRITVDGEPLHRGNLPSWQRVVGYVPQDVFLFDDTLRANIAFGWPDDEIDNGAVAEAVEAAQLSTVIADLEGGLSAILGEHGVRLSGGQRQRVAIARALYVRPQVLVLDEATSALDNETEARFTQTIEGLRGNMTMLIVAHRLSTVRRCDRLIYLKEGSILAEGTFDQLSVDVPDLARAIELGDLGTSTRGA